MRKRGFTLVELLAVIAILAILILMALPAVLRMFRQSRMTSFENEVKSIYKQAQNQIVSDSLNLDAGGEKVYASDITTTTTIQGNLELQGGNNLKYCVVLDNSGNIKKLYVSNGTYMYMNENVNALKDIENIEAIDINGEDFITGIENCMETKSAVFDAGENVNVKMKQLANPTATNVTYQYIDTNIKSIKHSTTEPSSANKEAKNKVSASTSDLDIYMWYEDGTIYWWSEDNTPSLNYYSNLMFVFLSKLEDIDGLSTIDASNAASFSCIFYGNNSLKNIDGLKYWDTSNVLNLYGAFTDCAELTNLDALKYWDTSNVKSMRGAFQINGPSYNTGLRSKLTDISGLSNWDTSSVTNFRNTFTNCHNLESADYINFWNINSATDTTGMFNINVNGTYILNPVHPTFKYLDSNGIENNVPGSWDNNGTFVKQ